MRIARKLFLVPLANNDHGKTTMLKAFLSQGGDYQFDRLRMAPRSLVSPWGRAIDAYVFGRSYQEVEKAQHGSVIGTLEASDPHWRERELIVFSSHVSHSGADIDEMITAAHQGGFDAVCATVLFTGQNPEDRRIFADVWSKNWDERWVVPNPRLDPADRNLASQLDALGRDLWTWTCRALAS